MNVVMTTLPADFQEREEGGWAPESEPWPVVTVAEESTSWAVKDLPGRLYRRLVAASPVCVIPDLTGLRDDDRVGVCFFTADHTGIVATKQSIVAEIRDGRLLLVTVEAPADGPETQRLAAEIWRGIEWTPERAEPAPPPPPPPGSAQTAPPPPPEPVFTTASPGTSLLALPRITGTDLQKWVDGEPGLPDSWKQTLDPSTPQAVFETLAGAVKQIDARSEPDVVARCRFAGHTSLAAITFAGELALVIDGPSPFQLLGEEASSWPEDFMLTTHSDVAVILARWAGLGPRRHSPCPVTELTLSELTERTATADAEREPWGTIEIESTENDERLSFIWTPLSGFYRLSRHDQSVSIEAESSTGTEIWNRIVRLCTEAAASREETLT